MFVGVGGDLVFRTPAVLHHEKENRREDQSGEK
jgi:hypothetical protein